MKFLRVIRSCGVAALSVALASFCLTAFQSATAGAVANAAPDANVTRPAVPLRAFPSVEVDGGRKVEYLGMFSPDGKFKKLTKMGRFRAKHGGSEQDGESSNLGIGLRPGEVPSHIELRSSERKVQDPSHGHAVATVEAHSTVVEVFDSIVRGVYGPELVLCAPGRLVTDSRNFVVISDPALPAIHVLDPEGEESFRIVGGGGNRLQSPAGVAVDLENNIYVADSELGLVLVYAPDGKFLRYLGTFKGENLFESPTGIAIDAKAGRLYVLDTPLHYLYVLNLQGKVLQRIGKRHGGSGAGEFTAPTQVVLTNREIVVLDSDDSRIQWFNLDGKFVREFRPEISRALGGNKITSFAFDGGGEIFLSAAIDASIRIFSRDGRLVSSFGANGFKMGEFKSPTGIWIDTTDRLYVADTGNRRVQVFRLTERQ